MKLCYFPRVVAALGTSASTTDETPVRPDEKTSQQQDPSAESAIHVQGRALMPVRLGPRPGHAEACSSGQIAQRPVTAYQQLRWENGK